jgi:serine acetyltransferase
MNLTDKQTGEQKSLSAARFLIDKQVKINAGAVFVAELNRAKIVVGTPLRVTYLRKEGNTKLYTLTLLG